MQEDRDILLVVCGWDGLITNQGAFLKLFRLLPSRISIVLRILAEDLDDRDWLGRPRPHLYDVDPLQVCEIWSGDRDLEDINVRSSLRWSTCAFLKIVPAIASTKMALSYDLSTLHELTNNRNTHRWAKQPTQFPCKEADCPLLFETSDSRAVHWNRDRRPRTEEEMKLDLDFRTCQFCGRTFARGDGRQLHEREACPQNPDIKRKSSPPSTGLKRTRRVQSPSPTPPPLAEGEERAYEHLPAEERLMLPRIDIHDPVIYRRESFCRYPGCDVVRRIEPTKHLRHYYQVHHNFVMANFTTSLHKQDEEEHDRGRQWLATCAVRGVVGDPPRIRKM
ncbi:hypothetical protein POX_b02175 [Penicillium oxalicum]|uniref:hypothetical protein n=1 Tax=Penicillium oxalicum TaxID=69781 RepID=UPI0020B7BF0C|nr:hypothetical protein POX_b02175 [Penicillium oxalicum]KAI2792139.1 hypothetical protein POX_b02175 [Penicillium oxalicum]